MKKDHVSSDQLCDFYSILNSFQCICLKLSLNCKNKHFKTELHFGKQLEETPSEFEMLKVKTDRWKS